MAQDGAYARVRDGAFARGRGQGLIRLHDRAVPGMGDHPWGTSPHNLELVL
ncbi:hypothetical protein R6V09_40555 [Streptomyces sp. W16]|uniref:hypothetical protein n=1 Tax=Streptomyces sp. W16 TaxID=3076631 RepID=UPI00295C217B|nr:hypothetical protein [Streptomyces sp. W16]MDV9176404.1 hypothetical protein [Streptomyces sp. W16]